ncbi:hypothetical protein JMN32_00125 [Fulvivirga sp. 29W222]|uniref:FeoB-associated Cys-rich membrane protein n=1 Tax=Fulvivirga marina TaxID=2494733 RepID=A0A937KBZ9_9BACT|nr:hypothetical protein [Fulvivirga marina]MBL6444693.1 hypothetical protein [Fulvivirga marina]
MKTANKTELTIAILSGTFLVLSIIRVSIDLYKAGKNSKCTCGQDKAIESHAG